MNFYPLNVTPINGWATYQGFAEVTLSLELTGESANVVLGSAEVDLSLDVSGDGTRRTFGTSDVQLYLDVVGDGTRETFGVADVEFQLMVEGSGKTSHPDWATCTLMLTWPLGLGGIIVNGSADATMQLEVEGNGDAATGIFGDSRVIMLIQVDANGRSTFPAKGKGNIDMWLNPRATPNMIAHARADTTLQLLAAAPGRVAHQVFAGGDIVMDLSVIRSGSSQYREVRGSGESDFIFDMTARDSRVVVVPSTFYPAPLVRGMHVNYELRSLRIPRPDRVFDIQGA